MQQDSTRSTAVLNAQAADFRIRTKPPGGNNSNNGNGNNVNGPPP